MTVLAVRPIDQAFLAACASLVGLNVADVLDRAPEPEPSKGRPATPYLIVQRIDYTSWTGPPGDHAADAPVCYQTTVVDRNATGAQEWADRLRAHLLARDASGYTTPITPDSGTIMARRSLSAGLGDGDASVDHVVERYVLHCTAGTGG